MAKTAHVFSSSFTGSGANALSEPAGVAVNNATGDVYVVDKGHNRVEEFNATGTAVLAEFNGSVGPPQPFSSPEAIAVDNSGSAVDPSKEDVYVADTGHGVIDKFSSIGVYEGQLTGTCASPGTCPGSIIPFGGPLQGVAVDPEGNVWVDAGGEETHVDEFSDTGSFVKAFNTGHESSPGLAVDSSDNVYLVNSRESVSKYEPDGTAITGFFGFSSNVSALAIDASTNNLFVDKAGSIEEYGPFGEPFSEPLATFPSKGLSGSDGIAVSDTGTVYATQRAAGSVDIFPEVPFPVLGVEPVSNRAVRSATLNGTVDPEGVEVTSCDFEYGTEAGVYPQKEPCSQTLPLTGSAPVPVSANLAGLAPDTTYHYRLLATNADSLTEVTPDQEFTTRGAGITDESVENVEPTAATLQARINPNESETTYQFEYDTSPYSTSASHGTSLPVPAADIGSGTSPVPVSVQLKGLQPDTSYYYRAVAQSTVNSTPTTIDGPDATFKTNPAPGAEAENCPENAQRRAEQPFAKALPDCRAYEQVSPVDTNDSNAVNRGGQAFIHASAKGEAITYNSFGSFAEPTGQTYESQYVSRRGPGGWSTQNITPPYKGIESSVTPPYMYLTFTPELSSGLTETDVPLTSEATAGYSLYLADFAKGASASSYELLTNSEYAVVQGASTDLSHVVFDYSAGRAWVTYEWVNGKSYQVNIAPNGTEMTVHAPVGQTGDFWRSVSDNGLRVLMTSEATPEQVYVRENPEQEQSPLNGEECTVPGDACTVEVSASQRTTVDRNGPQPARYRGASVEGSRVFFTSRAELTEDANTGPADNAENLYEYDLGKPAGERLTDLTVDTKDTDGAGVLGVVDISEDGSEDGSYVYFVAEGGLASNENANKETATPGQPNLYLAHDGATTFIATLSIRDSEDWSTENGPDPASALYTVRETPDGTHLAFLSTKSLTGYDNEQAAAGECEGIRANGGPTEGGGCNEVYEYDADASSEPLTCASCNPSGARPVGPSRFAEEASFVPFAEEHYTPRNFSEDGSRLFFQSKDALVPKDSNGLVNVFEYEDGHVYAISDVAGGYASSFLDASANGDDVFIATADRLLPQDAGLRNAVYDARVDGGYPVSVAPPACDNADACKAPVSSQPAVFGAPASATFSGPGSLAPVVSKPAVKPKPETRAQKLKKALKACKKLKQKTKRLACERQANKKYGPVKKKAKRSSTHSKKGRK
jgi:hypothetical protein